MKFILTFPLCVFLFLTIKNNAQKPATETQVVTGLVLKNDKTAFDFKTFLADLGTSANLKTEKVSIAENTLDFQIGDLNVLVSDISQASTEENLLASTGISWLWKNAEKEVPAHKSHLAISILGKPGQSLAMYKLFTQIAVSALQNTNSSGIYMPNQYLVVSKGYYLEAARNMSDINLPIYLWVYFGLAQQDGKAGGYTYGLKEFGFDDMEIVQSDRPVQEVHAFLYDKTMEVVLENKHLKAGEKVAAEDGKMVDVQVAEGTFLEGKMVKLGF